MKLKESKRKRDSKKKLAQNSEETSFIEMECGMEELMSCEELRDCISVGEADDKNIIERVILF